ncbi:hypothetical protein LPJ66_004122 [Kickxella alabastrina]|uniref:Uncharacterized protein n=1 Tax=Kickxella alabastrina TaxID=61397 RepID=A0ACC1ILY4_9FUNG|nr:hypothetical protein LPJ66_004122 [Kickxella alabastrina]
MTQNTFGDSRKELGRAEYNEDEELVNAMARQYVLDAEAAGSASPSHRSRQNTDASRMATLHSIDASEEDFPPQLPLLKHMVDQQQQQQQQHANAASHVVMPMPMPADAYAYTDEKHAVGSPLGRNSRTDQGRSGSVTTGYDEDYESNGGNIGNGPRALSERLRDEEVEDDANEARLFVSARQRYPPPKYSYSADLSVPLGTILFLLGFVLLPLWWIGAVFPRTPNSDVVRTWRKYNALMTLLSLPLLGLFLALGGWQAVHG